MGVDELSLTNFRCFPELSLSLGTTTLLVGPNGRGKTSLLEALVYLSLAKSYRARSDRELIHWEAPFFRLLLQFQGGQQLERTLELDPAGGLKKRTRQNEQSIATIPSLGAVHTVLFAPELIELVTGSPRLRRQYLDMVLSTIDRHYATTLVRYQHALRQRNALCRPGTDDRLMEPWESRLVDEGTRILEKRQALCHFLQSLLPEAYRAIADARGAADVSLRYASTIPDEAQYQEELQRARGRDRYLGSTSKGPHRDDLEFLVDGRPAHAVLSRGEQRSLLLALKQAELQFLAQRSDDAPLLLLLDDMFSELDQTRSRALVSLLGTHQAVITATDATYVSPALRDRATIIAMEDLSVARTA